MTLKWNGEQALRAARQEMARRLLAAAAVYTTEHRKRLNVSNPRPYLNSSRENEYPRARSGFGRDSTSYEPTTPQGVIDAGFIVRLGYRQSGFYMAVQEVRNRRLGLVRSFEELKGAIRAVLEKQA